MNNFASMSFALAESYWLKTGAASKDTQTKEAGFWIAHLAEEAENEGRERFFRGGLPTRIQFDIAELDSIQLRKDRKGWRCVRIALFCFD